MKIFHYGELSEAPEGAVVAIGFFDGVHTAHRSLILKAQEVAREKGAPFGIVSFYSESEIKKESARLYSTEEKLLIFRSIGADFTVLLNFGEIRALSPEEFVKKILREGLRICAAAVGFNFRFGMNAGAGASELSSLMKEYGKDTVIFNEITHGGKTVSATLIRSLIEAGEIERANLLLGSPYFLSGKVVRGNGQGHSLGFPTVNTDIPEGKVKPKTGVYRSVATVDGRSYDSVTNVGVCPTFGKRNIHAETYIIGFSDDVYGKTVTVSLMGYLREEREFSSPEELKMQIEVDKNNAIKGNGEEKWQELGLK